MTGYDFSQIPSVDAALQESICQWFQDEEKLVSLDGAAGTVGEMI